MAFQENLKYYREKNGYTAKELAELIDIPYSTYLNYEKINQGRRTEPRYDTLCKIANILQVTTDELLGYSQRYDLIKADIVGKQIIKARQSRNLTPQGLAQMIAVPIEEIEKYEEGRKIPSLNILTRISVELCVHINYLLGLPITTDSDIAKERLLFSGLRITDAYYDGKDISFVSDKTGHVYALEPQQMTEYFQQVTSSDEYKECFYQLYLKKLMELERKQLSIVSKIDLSKLKKENYEEFFKVAIQLIDSQKIDT